AAFAEGAPTCETQVQINVVGEQMDDGVGPDDGVADRVAVGGPPEVEIQIAIVGGGDCRAWVIDAGGPEGVGRTVKCRLVVIRLLLNVEDAFAGVASQPDVIGNAILIRGESWVARGGKRKCRREPGPNCRSRCPSAAESEPGSQRGAQ